MEFTFWWGKDKTNKIHGVSYIDKCCFTKKVKEMRKELLCWVSWQGKASVIRWHGIR